MVIKTFTLDDIFMVAEIGNNHQHFLIWPAVVLMRRGRIFYNKSVSTNSITIITFVTNYIT